MKHEHLWRRTGESKPTTRPIWIWACDSCHSIGEGRDSEPVYNITPVFDEEEWARYYGPTDTVRRTKPDA